MNVVNDWIYEVEDLVSHTKCEVHACRMKLYAESSLNVDEELFEQSAHDGAGYEVEDFLDIHKKDGTWEVRVRWRGWATGDETWEPLQNLMEDVPVLVTRWLKSTNSEAACQALQVYNIDHNVEREVSSDVGSDSAGAAV